ncbi:MAG TPA: uracil-DNA glycosylase [Paracoccaceae bacterium]|nr:uracil-DNA glycosylase [Paracoccaceae bacterium]
MTGLPAPPDAWADLPFFAEAWPALRDRLNAAAEPWAPDPPNLFRALALTPPAALRAVILGQDPYPTPGRATGLAFGFPTGMPPRDSLRNILAELHGDLGIDRPDGDLSGWAGQGVLLLNTALTVPLGRPGGHARWGWDVLVGQVLARAAAARPLAFLLWGRPAQAAAAPYADPGRHLVVAAPHPSPLSAHRGFRGHRPFSAVNRWLAARGESPIDWAA